MRIRISRFLTVSIVVINFLLFLISWKYFISSEKSLQRFTSNKPPINTNDFDFVTTIKNNKNRLHELKKFLQKSLTVILRDFYHFDNDLKSGIDHLLNLLPDLRILVISENQPYPPINIFRPIQASNQTINPSTLIYKDNVQFIPLTLDLTKKASENNPINYIQTKYVLFLPDNFKLSNARHLFQRLIRSIDDEYNAKYSKNPRKVLIIPFTSNQKSINYCFQINVDMSNWTLEYNVKNNSTFDCDLYTQKHGMLMESFLLHDFLEPFQSPFPEYFYLQAKLADIKLMYSNESFSDGAKKLLMSSYHSRTKRKTLKKEQFKWLYKKLQFKKIVKRYHYIPEDKTASLKNLKKNRNKGNKQFNEKNAKNNANFKNNGKEANAIDVLIDQLEIPSSMLANYSTQVQIKTDISYFGCEKNTKSCIGQVYNEKPFYLYLNRRTPPCCLEKLKTIFQYVIEELENTGVRYWLDNSALRNAIEINDLSSDAYEIDISFNINDYNRSTAIRRCYDSRPFTDLAGFYWIKATDGHYLKVQFSKTNDIHVNLLPFEIRADQMIPKGFYGRKAKSFSIEYVHPMSSVNFLGKTVFVPNNVRNYLVDKGWIEKY